MNGHMHTQSYSCSHTAVAPNVFMEIEKIQNLAWNLCGQKCQSVSQRAGINWKRCRKYCKIILIYSLNKVLQIIIHFLEGF